MWLYFCTAVAVGGVILFAMPDDWGFWKYLVVAAGQGCFMAIEYRAFLDGEFDD